MLAIQLTIVFAVLSCQNMTNREAYLLRQSVKADIVQLDRGVQFYGTRPRSLSLPAGAGIGGLGRPVTARNNGSVVIKWKDQKCPCLIDNNIITKDAVNALREKNFKLRLTGRWAKDVKFCDDRIELYNKLLSD